MIISTFKIKILHMYLKYDRTISDVQIHRPKKESLSMSSRVEVGVPKTEVNYLLTLFFSSF